MRDEDLLKCPILTGLDPMHRAELLGWLNSSSNLRAKMEECLTEKQIKLGTEPADSESTPRDFNKAVHSWNPQERVFNRSLKE